MEIEKAKHSFPVDFFERFVGSWIYEEDVLERVRNSAVGSESA